MTNNLIKQQPPAKIHITKFAKSRLRAFSSGVKGEKSSKKTSHIALFSPAACVNSASSFMSLIPSIFSDNGAQFRPQLHSHFLWISNRAFEIRCHSIALVGWEFQSNIFMCFRVCESVVCKSIALNWMRQNYDETSAIGWDLQTCRWMEQWLETGMGLDLVLRIEIEIRLWENKEFEIFLIQTKFDLKFAKFFGYMNLVDINYYFCRIWVILYF